MRKLTQKQVEDMVDELEQRYGWENDGHRAERERLMSRWRIKRDGTYILT